MVYDFCGERDMRMDSAEKLMFSMVSVEQLMFYMISVGELLFHVKSVEKLMLLMISVEKLGFFAWFLMRHSFMCDFGGEIDGFYDF